MINLWKKYKEAVLYLLFGAGTTLVNIITYYICAHSFHLDTTFSNCAAWIVSVLFAYVTNKIWVFESKETGLYAIGCEIISFVSCRLLTGILDIMIMFVGVNILKWNDMFIKILSNILVIILNYIASKRIIFKEK